MLTYREARSALAIKNEWQLDSYQLAIHWLLINLADTLEDIQQEVTELHNRIEELSSIKTRPAEPITAINPLSNGSKKGYTK